MVVKPGEPVVATVAVLAAVWAGLLVSDASAGYATSLDDLTQLGRWPVVAALLVAVACTAVGLLLRSARPRWGLPPRLWLLIPQQMICLLAASAAVSAIIRQQFGDGVRRPWQFIAADQAPILLLAATHLVAVVLIARGSEIVRQVPDDLRPLIEQSP